MKTVPTIFSDFLKDLGVPHTVDNSDRAFRGMAFQSLFGFSRLLDSYKIPNEAVKFSDKLALRQIPVPFLAQLGDLFVIVNSFDDTADGTPGVQYTLYHKDYCLAASEFEKKWTGVALLAYPDKESGEPEYTKHHLFEMAETGKLWLLIGCTLLLFVYGFITSGLWKNLSTWFLTAIDLFGIYITWQLLLKSLKVNVKTADRICGILQAHGCDTVLEQKASKFFGLFGWAEVGVAYFTISLIVMILFPGQLHYLALANGCCLPFTVWSISYQKFKLHTWCTLCVITQCLLWMLFLCYLLGGWWHGIFPLRWPFFLIVAAYAAALFGINRITTFINSRTAK